MHLCTYVCMSIVTAPTMDTDTLCKPLKVYSLRSLISCPRARVFCASVV